EATFLSQFPIGTFPDGLARLQGSRGQFEHVAGGTRSVLSHHDEPVAFAHDEDDRGRVLDHGQGSENSFTVVIPRIASTTRALTPPNGVASVRNPGTSSTLTEPQRSSRMQRVIAARSFETIPAESP